MADAKVKEVLAKLEVLGNERVREQNVKRGAGDLPQFGVRLGEIRKVAKEVRADHDLGLELWETGILEARLLAVLAFKPGRLTIERLDELVRSVRFVQVFDWLDSYVIRKHPEKEALRTKWADDPDPWAARAYWSLTAERVGKSPDGLDLPGLLDRIEGESFSGTIAGPGELSIATMTVDEADFRIGGSGNVTAAGTAREASVSIGGSGEVRAGGLMAQTAEVSIGGSGDVALTVQEDADISIAGSGDVDISGPARCSVSRMGSGEVRCSGGGGDTT